MSSTSTSPPPKPSDRSSIGWQLLRQKPLADPTTPFTGKTILITGANSGLGLAAATKFAALSPARLILGLWHLDMASHASVAAFARRAADDLPRLDVAVLNAGVYEVARGVSAHGWERTLQVNTLSTALLAVLLLPKLRASSAGRRGEGGGGGGGGRPSVLEVVASRRVEAVQLAEEQREGGAGVLGSANSVQDGGYKPSEQYRMSKFLLMGVVKKLAALVDASEVTVTAVCPGGVATNLSRGALLNALIMRTPEYAARSVVSGALLEPQASGKLWYDDELHEVPNLAGEDGQKLAEKIWAEVTDALRRDVPAVGNVLKTLPGFKSVQP
ncbi:hypothetical protein C8A01DRAFT_46788 [Parachaetomium inaequale]|uniref:Short-chain dehydrogenase n=1 Tax=Parachaetomium inaequale TaxID=2588326 RepID=A0AAN6PF74_9PEZI|nr:hypothetical protein C8A01DRAFT_46788 [Parachaetomium inaequale]